MSALEERLRKARTLTVECGEIKLSVLRPTVFEYQEKLRGPAPARGLASLVTGWDGATELSLTGSGAPHPLPFDSDACAEWLMDRPVFFRKVMTAVVEAYEEYATRLEVAEKN